MEPEWYIPIIPMVLVNGAEGIGTGWACKLPNYDPREIVNNIYRMLSQQDPLPMVRARLSSTWSLEDFLLKVWELGLPSNSRLSRSTEASNMFSLGEQKVNHKNKKA